jgi:hypothetical protein
VPAKLTLLLSSILSLKYVTQIYTIRETIAVIEKGDNTTIEIKVLGRQRSYLHHRRYITTSYSKNLPELVMILFITVDTL